MNSNTSELKDEDWQNLRQEVERYYPTFREAMYQGEYLKPKEYNLCLLIKADFISKEIEYLLGYQEKTLSTMKRRLLLKIFRIDGSAKDFNRMLYQAGRLQEKQP